MEPLKRKLTPDRVVEILAKHGTKITREEAVALLEFLEKMAKLAMEQVFETCR